MSSSVFAFTKMPYAKDTVKLASLIRNRNYADVDSCRISGEEIDDNPAAGIVLKSVDKNFHGRMESSNSFFKSEITKLLLKQVSHDSNIPLEVSVKDACTYMLCNPKTVFSNLCKRKSVQKWLELQYIEKCKVFFVIGYRTLLDAELFEGMGRQRKARKLSAPVGTSPGAGNFRAAVGFEPTGERIYAICYRQVNFKFWKESDEVHYKSDAEWTVLRNVRTTKSREKEIIQVDLEDKMYDGVARETFPTEEPEERETFIALHPEEDAKEIPRKLKNSDEEYSDE